MNKIGFNLLVWSAVISDELNPLVDKLKTMGYDGVEVLIGTPDIAAYKRLGDYTKQLGLGVTAVFVTGKEENPISETASVRAKALDRIKWAIDRAYEINATLLSGPFHSAHRHFAQHAPQGREYGWSAEILHKAGEYAAEANITIGLEAVNRFECYLCNTMEQLKHLVNLVDHSNIKAMFDTHHAHIEEKKLAGAISTIAPMLVHVHISENDRGTPGDGQVHFDEAFASLAGINYQGWLTIEAFSRNDPDFANAIGVWREYSNPWKIAENGLNFIKQMCRKHSL